MKYIQKKPSSSDLRRENKKSIYIIDDDAAILEVISMILSEVGYKVKAMEDGSKIKHLNGEQPDLILLDIWLSGWDGRDIGRYLKSNEKTRNIPIIMLSAHKNIKKITSDIGADDFIEKPFEINNLLSKVKKYVNY